ncbi:hypothetical protein EDD21DRAFT_372277 [Dissophora ornata]|nr:hypothetical protein EDD21DRAFT_372277 [Dissophora ornata]
MHLLLRCCSKQHLIAPDESSDTIVSIPPPFIDYLSLYHDQLARYYYFMEQWVYMYPVGPFQDKYPYGPVRAALASHHPEVISQLYIPMSSLKSLVPLAPKFSSLKRLEVLCFTRDDLEEEYDSLLSFVSSHRQVYPNTLQELYLATPQYFDNIHISTSPLSLYGWTHLSKLDLTHWRGTLDWSQLPRTHLSDLRIDIQVMDDSFDPESFFRPCTKLHTLHVLGVRDSTFDWVLQESPHQALPRLTVLEIGGTTVALKACLEKALRAFSESLLSLTITLRQVATVFEFGSITWSRVLPRLTSLTIKDKAIFEFDPAVIKSCPALRVLTLGVDAEHSGPGCLGMGDQRYLKWARLTGTLDRCVQQLTVTRLQDIVENLENLTFLEVSQSLAWRDEVDGMPDFLKRGGLVVRPIGDNFHSETDECELRLI